MGDHATPKAVNMYLSKVHKPFSKLQRAARELGDNPQFIELDGATKAPNDGTGWRTFFSYWRSQHIVFS
jgi:hypothetical protein